MTGQEDIASRCARRGSGGTSGKIPSWKGLLGIGMGCLGDGVTTPGGVHETTGCGTWSHSFVDKMVVSQRLGFIILEVFSNLNDSMILN